MFNYCWNSPPVSPSFKGEVLAPYFTMPPCTLASEKNFPGVVATLTSVGVGRRWELMLERSARSAVRATARRGEAKFAGAWVGDRQGLPSRGNRIDMSQAQARRREVGWWGRRVYLYRERRRKCVKKYWGPGCSITRGSFRCLDITFVVREVGSIFFFYPTCIRGRAGCVRRMDDSPAKGRERKGWRPAAGFGGGIPPKTGIPQAFNTGIGGSTLFSCIWGHVFFVV